MRRLLPLLLVLSCGCPREETAPTPAPTASATPAALVSSMVADDAVPTDSDDEVVAAMQAFADAPREMSAADKAAVFALFKRLRVHTKKAKNRALYREVAHTLIATADPAWEPDLIAMLAAPIPAIVKKTFKPAMDQVYWQSTAAKILGALRSETAVQPLIGVVLAPNKDEVAKAALNALARIGKPAVTAAAKLIATHPAAAVEILGHIGTLDAKEHLIEATKSKSESLQRLAAAQLPRVPLDADAFALFESLYTEELIDAAPWFFHPKTAALILQKTPGQRALDHALTAADAKLWPDVERLFDEVNATASKAELAGRRQQRDASKALLDRCSDNPRCYREALERAGPERQPALRAAHMLAILRAPRPWIAKLALTTNNNDARKVLGAALIALSPKGDADVANSIDAAYAKAKRNRNIPKLAALEPLVHVAIVLRARGR